MTITIHQEGKMNTQDDSIDGMELLELLEDEPNPNGGCLEGMQCPKCGSFGPFKIGIHTIAEVCDEGVEDEPGDHEWEDDSYCECMDCDCSGTVATFSGQEAAPARSALETINADLLRALKLASINLALHTKEGLGGGYATLAQEAIESAIAKAEAR